MATFDTFQKYPIIILGVKETDNQQLTDMEEQVINKIAYTGEQVDIQDVINFFVYCEFVKFRSSSTSVQNGERFYTVENTTETKRNWLYVWNLACDNLQRIATDAGETFNCEYASNYSNI